MVKTVEEFINLYKEEYRSIEFFAEMAMKNQRLWLDTSEEYNIVSNNLRFLEAKLDQAERHIIELQSCNIEEIDKVAASGLQDLLAFLYSIEQHAKKLVNKHPILSTSKAWVYLNRIADRK